MLELDEKFSGIFDQLTDSGWIVGGGCAFATLRIDVAAAFDSEIKQLKTDDVLSLLPVMDEAGQLLPGFEVSDDPDTGTVCVSYEGPLDDTAATVFSAMAEVGLNNLESLTEFGQDIGRLAASATAGYYWHAQTLLLAHGVSPVGHEQIVETARQLVGNHILEWQEAVLAAEEA